MAGMMWRTRRWPLLGLAVALAVVGWAGSASAGETDWLGLRNMNIAHQGGENEVPSNTMYAYERALRLGGDMLEVDIHTSADGQLVVLHDATVDRTTNGTGRVYDKTLAEVQALDAGFNMVPGEGTEGGRAAASRSACTRRRPRSPARDRFAAPADGSARARRRGRRRP